MILFVAQQT